METPLLALTRPPIGVAPDTVAAETMRQLIQLRWIAVVGQLLTILLVRFWLAVPLPLVEMLGVVAVLALANFGTLVALPRHRVRNAELMMALLFDMGALTLQLYFSGGATNPFITLFLLQVVLGAILLRPWSVWVLVGAACLSYGVLCLGYLPLRLPPALLLDARSVYLLGTGTAFTMVAVLLVLFITRISRNLRARDHNLAELRRRAAEEDGIVRMGLFASGAAHELGTPLATLAVILADWRRLPRIADDPELAGEVAEMQAEVQRCKTIVSDILRSAGEPRGEAMGSTPAAAFIADAVDAWHAAHPQVPLDHRAEALGNAVLAGEPALRQAIWNLLDNAAEASPLSVGFHARVEGGTLVLAVRDEGPGFTAAQLAVVGKPVESSKGAGHGVGLFLSANVARRLGGGLVAENRDGKGAEVRLELPLVMKGVDDA